MQTTKQEFMNRPKIAKLSEKERNARWRQHLASNKDEKALARTGRSRNTNLAVRKTPLGHVADIHLTRCAKDYMLAIAAPFSLKDVACIPDLHALPSKKMRVKGRGTFQTGLDGQGYLLSNVWSNANNTGTIITSTSALASSTGPLLPLAAGTQSISQPKLPYASTSFKATVANPGIEARTVGFGVRVRYIGPEISRSGQIVGLRHPNNGTLVQIPYTQFLSYESARVYPNSRKWVYAMYRPCEPREYEYSPDPYTASDGSPTTPPYSLGFAILGTTDSTGVPGPAQFEFEFIHYLEYLGTVDTITSSHVDLVGISHVRNALPERSSTDNVAKHLSTFVKKVEDSIGESLPAAAGGAMLYKNMGTAASATEGASVMETLSATAAEVGEGLASAAEFVAPLLGLL